MEMQESKRFNVVMMARVVPFCMTEHCVALHHRHAIRHVKSEAV